jgi:hypothetical protein
LRQDFDMLVASARGGKAFAEGEKQPGIALKTNLSSDQGHQQALLLGQETEPGFSVSRDLHVRLAGKTLLDLERSILDRDRGRTLFRASESELKSCVESSRLIGLEDIGHEVEQPVNRPRPETVAYGLHRLVLEFPPRHRFGVGAWHHIDRLRALLKRSHDLPKVALLVSSRAGRAISTNPASSAPQSKARRRNQALSNLSSVGG